MGAKNRLNKFYNPKLYKAPPKTELSSEDRIVENMSGTAAPTAAPGGIAGTGITVFAQTTHREAPPPPPATFGAYTKKSEDIMIEAQPEIGASSGIAVDGNLTNKHACTMCTI